MAKIKFTILPTATEIEVKSKKIAKKQTKAAEKIIIDAAKARYGSISAEQIFDMLVIINDKLDRLGA